jgi:hypothetical protein
VTSIAVASRDVRSNESVSSNYSWCGDPPRGISRRHGVVWDRRQLTGVWVVSDCPFDCNPGVVGHSLLTLDIPEEIFAEYEWVQDGNSYREALIPAKILNCFSRPVIVADDDERAGPSSL